jgi:acetylornithine/succinyldiaminopimelate/putrescine aminotransferase
MIEAQAPQVRRIGQRIMDGFHSLVAEFPDRLRSVQGRGHLAGLKFHRVQDALDFHQGLLRAGLWTRVHAYHAGHSTLLTKLGLLADEPVVDFLLGKFRDLLAHPR